MRADKEANKIQASNRIWTERINPAFWGNSAVFPLGLQVEQLDKARQAIGVQPRSTG